MLLTLRPNRRPGQVMQVVLMIGAFIMSIAWLNVIANEIVSVLQSLGLLATVSTGTFAVGTLNKHVFVAVTSVCSLNVPV